MKAKTLFLSTAVIFAACSDEPVNKFPSCTAVVGGAKWTATSFQSVKKETGTGKIVESIMAMAEDGTSIVFNVEVMALSPSKLSAKFRSKTATISYFSGSLVGNSIHLQWTTSSESDVSYFQLERSYDGISYHSVGTLSAVGFSSIEQNYYLIQPNESPTMNKAYFRLKIVSYNSITEVTEPIEVKLKHEVSYRESFATYGGYEGKVQLTEYNEVDKTISGNFSFKYMKEGREVAVREGVISNVPY